MIHLLETAASGTHGASYIVRHTWNKESELRKEHESTQIARGIRWIHTLGRDGRGRQ